MIFKTLTLLLLINLFLIISINANINNELCYVKINIENIESKATVGNYLVLVNSRKHLLLDNIRTSPDGEIILNLSIGSIYSHEGNHSIAVYVVDSGLDLVHLQDLYLTSKGNEECIKHANHELRHKRLSPSGHSVGVQYSVWQTFGSFAQNKIHRNGGLTTNMERIMQAGGAISDYWSHGVNEDDAHRFYYMTEPKNGYYCIYRKRPNEAHGVVDDCADVENTFARHADMFVSSGIDYIYVDLTNYCGYNPEEDGIQRRPMELLFEEWSKLRTQKKQTPQIVAWHRIDEAGCKTWRDYLNLYNRYPDLVWKDSKTGKMVFMATAESNANIKHEIESNGGKNNVIIVNNWVATPEEAQSGRWQFMGHCGAQQHKESSDIAARNTCDQAVTRNSPIGDQISVGVSYQMNYASAAWGASTSYYGLTFLLQWNTALRENPQHITISGWNEFVAQPQKNPWNAWSRSVGSNGEKYNRVFVDGWGAFRSRDIEPTVEYGDMYYNIMQSCVRVRNLNLNNNLKDCSVGNEVCCQLNDYKQFVEVHSLIKKDNTDYILVNSPQERDSLLTTYNEICVFNPASQSYCFGGAPNDPIIGLSGPLVMYNKNGANRKPLFRCKADDRHFFSTDDKCEGQTTEHIIGYLSTKKDSLFARSLIRCVTGSDYHYHALDGPCHPNDKPEAPLGFVI